MEVLLKVIDAGAGGRARSTEGSDRAQNFFGSLQERFPSQDLGVKARNSDNLDRTLDASGLAKARPSGRSSGQNKVAGSNNAEPSKWKPGRDGDASNDSDRAEADKENSRLLGTIDTREMKELMRRLNFTK